MVSHVHVNNTVLRSIGNMRFGYLGYGEGVQESSSTGTRPSVRCLPVALSVVFPLPLNKGSLEMGSVLEMGSMTVQKSWEER